MNGDGFDRADLIYVPRDASEVVVVREERDASNRPVLVDDPEGAAAFQAFIDANDDLSDARARSSNATRRARRGTTSSTPRISQQITTLRGQRIELTLDIENLLSLLGSSLGEVRTVDFQRYNLVDFRGYDDEGRQIISFDAPGENDVAEVSDFASRWRMQFGVRYTF